MRWTLILVGGVLAAALLATCRGTLPLTPCDTSADCPEYYRCDAQRHYCTPEPPRPCELLHLSAGGLDAYPGARLQVVVLEPGGQELDRFETTVEEGGISLQRNLHLEPARDYRLHALLDLDGDARCGPGDHSWAAVLRSRPCPAVVVLTPPEPGQLECLDFELLGDANGDGCVDLLDLQLVRRDFGLEGEHAGDVDGDLDVDHNDLESVENQWCLGHAQCCAERDGGVPQIPLNALTGDVDCDGGVSTDDLVYFDLAMNDPAGYAARFDCPRSNADVNCDGLIDEADRGLLEGCSPNGYCDCP